jgi:hypothetical protein
MNGLYGVRYSRSVRHSRVSKPTSESESGAKSGRSRTRGTVQNLPAAATKLQSVHDTTSNSPGTGNGDVSKQSSDTKVEKDGDTVMGSEATTPTTASVTPSAGRDTEMAEAS